MNRRSVSETLKTGVLTVTYLCTGLIIGIVPEGFFYDCKCSADGSPHVVTKLMQGIAVETGFEMKDVVLKIHLNMESDAHVWAEGDMDEM